MSSVFFRKAYCVIMEIILVKKCQLLFWDQLSKMEAEKIDFLLYKPAPQIFPLRDKWK